jgi:hypothetical protein
MSRRWLDRDQVEGELLDAGQSEGGPGTAAAASVSGEA